MALRVVLLSTLVFLAALGTHEVAHLAVIYAVGGQGSIIVRPWRLGLIDYSIYALHAQPVQQLDLGRQALVNFLGPSLAALPLIALLAAIREPVARLALIANVAILAFYTVIETADLLLRQRAGVDLSVLTTAEFNHGGPFLIIVFAASFAPRRARRRTD